jgi:LysR family glycine cleavage system transcriptional activator
LFIALLISLFHLTNMGFPRTGLGALRGFDAAARLGSFAAAAESLSVTQSAVSHQIRSLEDALGHPLFRRAGRAVVLTDAGRDFAQTVAKVLRTLDVGVERLAPYANPRSVIIYSDEAFARGFLMPRLPALRAALPEVDPWIDTSGRAVDFDEDEVDVLVTNRPTPADAFATELLRDARLALASPELIARYGGSPATLADLARWPLLHDEATDGWRTFWRTRGLEERDAPMDGLTFSDPRLALEAAAAGLGVALGSRAAATAMLAGGQLAIVMDPDLPLPSYRMLLDPTRSAEPAVAAVAEWLVAAATAR